MKTAFNINKRLLHVQGAGLPFPKDCTLNNKPIILEVREDISHTRSRETSPVIHMPGTVVRPLTAFCPAPGESDCCRQWLPTGVLSLPSGMWRTTFIHIMKKQFRNLISGAIFQPFSTCWRSCFEDYELPLSDPLWIVSQIDVLSSLKDSL